MSKLIYDKIMCSVGIRISSALTSTVSCMAISSAVSTVDEFAYVSTMAESSCMSTVSMMSLVASAVPMQTLMARKSLIAVVVIIVCVVVVVLGLLLVSPVAIRVLVVSALGERGKARG